MSTFRNLKFKCVLRWDSSQNKLRLFRIMANNFGIEGVDLPHSWKLSLSLCPKLFHFRSQHDYDKAITLLGIQVHFVLAEGGIFV